MSVSSTPAPSRSNPGHSVARTLAAILGAPLAAAAGAAALARCLPMSREWASACGYHALVPLWVLLACVLPLQRTGRRAWLVCAALSIPLAAALLLAAARHPP